VKQDTDAYMLKTALAYGATPREGVVVEDIKIDDNGVELFLADRENFQACYLVDATGFRSVLADKVELRDQAPMQHLIEEPDVFSSRILTCQS